VAVAFSHDSSILASLPCNGTVRLWNPNPGQQVQDLEKVPVTRTVSRSVDNNPIHIKHGAFTVEDRSIPDNGHIPRTPCEYPTNDTIMMNDSWVQQGLHNLLWLPHEYREGCTAVHGDILAIDRYSGQISFLQLDRQSI
jgi:hypothetical protein